jgi:hypothetical protein
VLPAHADYGNHVALATANIQVRVGMAKQSLLVQASQIDVVEAWGGVSQKQGGHAIP